jgi:hypothetical protein
MVRTLTIRDLLVKVALMPLAIFALGLLIVIVVIRELVEGLCGADEA